MALDPGWAGVLGAGVGTLGTLGVSWLERAYRRRDTADAHKHDDHLRRIDDRQALYAQCLKEFDALNLAVGRARWVWFETRPPQPAPVDVGRIRTTREQMHTAEESLEQAARSIELVAPASVLGPLGNLKQAGFETVLDAGARLNYLEQPAAHHPPPDDLPTMSWSDVRGKLLDAMRADLRVREPNGQD